MVSNAVWTCSFETGVFAPDENLSGYCLPAHFHSTELPQRRVCLSFKGFSISFKTISIYNDYGAAIVIAFQEI